MTRIFQKWITFLGLILFSTILIFSADILAEEEDSLSGFVSLFDGQSLSGWRKLTEFGGDDGGWEVQDGTIVGFQFPEGKGGLLVTEKTYGDFELYAEIKADYPIDSGIFLRVQPSVLSYQVTIDYRPEGEVGGLYCPFGGGFLVHNKEGKTIWQGEEFNVVRVRIKDQPPHIEAWINETKVLDYEDTKLDEKFRVPETGFLGIQVHPGPSWGEGKKVYFRKILIKEL